MTLALSDKIYGCVSNGRTALLDLENSTYLCLTDDLDPPIQKLLTGKPIDTNEENILQALVDEGVLIRTNGVRTFEKVGIELPKHHIPAEQKPAPFGAVGLAFAYQIAAAITLTFCPLAQVVEKHKARTRRLAMRPLEADLATLTKTAKAFEASERLLPSNNKCLRRSLAMATYLAHRGVTAKLVIAVKMRPFAAHAWTQVEDVVVNDHIDNVRPFTPILMV